MHRASLVTGGRVKGEFKKKKDAEQEKIKFKGAKGRRQGETSRREAEQRVKIEKRMFGENFSGGEGKKQWGGKPKRKEGDRKNHSKGKHFKTPRWSSTNI